MSNVYEIITNKILNRIEEAEKENKHFYFVKPWTGGCVFAESYTTRNTYYGINQLLLDGGEYITYKALMDYKKTLPEEEAEKIKIKKGCHKQQVFYYGTMDKRDKEGNPIQTENEDGIVENEKTYFVRYYNVYNIEDIEGLKSRYPAKHYDRTPTIHTQCLEEHIAAYARAENLTIDYVKDGGHCFYRPSEHMVRVPNKDEFKYDYGLYSSIMHEIIHSTSKGLNRDIGAKFGSEKYSKEELIAEIGSQMALNVFGIVPETEEQFNNDVAYIQGWAKYLKDNKKQILIASGKGQRAVEYFMEVSERQLMKEKYENMKEFVARYENGYLYVQKGATGDYYDYTIYNEYMIEADGGQIDKTETIDNVRSAAISILEDMNEDLNNAIEYVDIEEFKQIVEIEKLKSEYVARLMEERQKQQDEYNDR